MQLVHSVMLICSSCPSMPDDQSHRRMPQSLFTLSVIKDMMRVLNIPDEYFQETTYLL